MDVNVSASGRTDLPFMTSDGYLFENEDLAQDWIARRSEFVAAVAEVERLPETMDRRTYEAEAARLHVSDTWSDERIAQMGYAFTYGEFYPSPRSRSDSEAGYSTTAYLAYALGARRYRTIEAERKAAIAARQPVSSPVEMIHCDCGHSIPRSLVMSASLGTSCPDCYDRMSD